MRLGLSEEGYLAQSIMILGIISAVQILYKLVVILYQNLVSYGQNLPARYGEGSWAVVTGCTEGIGKAFAHELGRQKFNLVLVSRSQQKLDDLKQELLQAYKIEVRIVLADFTQSYKENFYEHIYDQIKNLDISLLVNNIGVGIFSHFHLQDNKIVKDMLYTNVFPIVFMSKFIIPHMLQRPTRSGIINLGSQAGKFTAPYISVYSGTKAFDLHFSQALSEEYSSKIDVLSLNPGGVVTKATQGLNLPNKITSEDCALSGLRKITGTRETDGDFRHVLNSFFTSLLPKVAQIKIFSSINYSLWKKQSKQQ